MKYYLVRVKMKWGEIKRAVRPSDIEAAVLREKDFEQKAETGFGKDNISEVQVVKLPEDHPEVIAYKNANPGK
ncbi:MAG TPA: hypothetical protein VGN00_14380 [Puia sp.]|jgi:hypothetical protein